MGNWRLSLFAVGIAFVAVLFASGFVGLGRLAPLPRTLAQGVPTASPTDQVPLDHSDPSPQLDPTPMLMDTGAVHPLNHDGVDYYLYLPNSAKRGEPISVLVALRGVGDVAEDFAKILAPQAEENGWVLIVPKFAYGDWKQVETLKADGRSYFPWLKSLLDALPGQTGLALRDQLLVYGFSRGGQAAHRFALLYPEKVMAVASMSAGSYTLPSDCTPADNHAPLDFPLGVADINSYCGKKFNPEAVAHVPFWIGVGEEDTAPGDVPQDFTRYIGGNRVERARAFAKAVSDLGAREELVVFPDLGHQETRETRAAAFAFLKRAEADQLTAAATVAASIQSNPAQSDTPN